MHQNYPKPALNQSLDGLEHTFHADPLQPQASASTTSDADPRTLSVLNGAWNLPTEPYWQKPYWPSCGACDDRWKMPDDAWTSGTTQNYIAAHSIASSWAFWLSCGSNLRGKVILSDFVQLLWHHGWWSGKGNHGHLHCLRAVSCIAPHGHWLLQGRWEDAVLQELPGNHEPAPLHGFRELPGLARGRHEGCEGLLGDSKRCFHLHRHWFVVCLWRLLGDAVHGCYEGWSVPTLVAVKAFDHCCHDDVPEGHHAEPLVWIPKHGFENGRNFKRCFSKLRSISG